MARNLIKHLFFVLNKIKSGGVLGLLEKVYLLLVGLASINCKSSVPSDIPIHNQLIPSENLQSQEYLQKIKQWTDDQKMILNQKKTKVMIFNFTEKYKFTTRLTLNNEHLEVVKQAKLLGVLISWRRNY